MTDNEPKGSEQPPIPIETTTSVSTANPAPNEENPNPSTSKDEEIAASKSKRSPEQRRKIAYDRIKSTYAKLSDKGILESLSSTETKIAIEGLIREWEIFLAAHDELNELVTTSDARTAQIEFFEKAAIIYREGRSTLEDHLKTFDKSIESTTSGNPNGSISIVVNTSDSEDEIPLEGPMVGEPSLSAKEADKFEPSINLKMEPIKLPKFNGEKENWILFREQFLSFVHRKKNIPNAIKMHLLFSNLSDNALRVIKGITPVASNYERAWNVLNHRYNNNQMLINHHLKRFFALSASIHGEPSSLIKLVDGTNELTNSLPGLNEPMKTWDSILIFCLLNKIDKGTQDDWNRYTQGMDKPSLNELLEFLDQRAQSNDTANSTLLVKPTFKKPEFKKGNKRSVFHVTTNSDERKCKLCHEQHPLYRCAKFRSLPVKERIQKARDAKVCMKCLSMHDPKKQCNFEKCPVCAKPHNRLLCYDDEKRRESKLNSSIENQIEQANVNHLVLKDDVASLLGTAEVCVLNTITAAKEMRCLCDSGSQLNLISEEAVRRLGLKPTRAKIQLNGVGGKAAEKSDGIVTIKFGPHFGGRDAIETIFFVVKRVTTHLPIESVHTDWLEKKYVNRLADPNFNQPAKIDALLGVNIWAAIVRPEIKHFSENIIGQKTRFGWVIFGSVSPRYGMSYKRKSFMSALLTQKPVDTVLNFLTKFWEQEEPPKKKFRTEEQVQVENHFQANFYRTPSGRYGVRLPFHNKVDQLGESRYAAQRQFYAVERRMLLNPELREKYIDFMREYIFNGHMSLADVKLSGVYFTPHHFVISSGKFRIVFNASHLTDTGLSLNDVLLIGEKLQPDLAILLLCFRLYKFGITADVKKMYRQIEVHPNDRKYQRIFWREKPEDPLMEYELNTITYGQAAAPYCAVRAMQQCAHDHKEEFPIGSKFVLNSFYMDDFLGGADTIEEAKEVKRQLEDILAKGGFELAKWCSNTGGCLNDDKTKLKEGIPYEEPETTSVLGLKWMPKEDVFVFNHKPIPLEPSWTKRQIMSAVGKLYDPNGFVAPFIITAKRIIQQIWQEGGDWDTPVSSDINFNWNKFILELPLINKLKIPRWFGTLSTKRSELHGFCDASEHAYCAAVYIRSPYRNENGDLKFVNHLVQSKTRVAPVSKKLTIPRMELNAALLCAELLNGIKEAFEPYVQSVYYWSDSQVVLHWLKKHPSELKTYAANRVNDIQELSDSTQWNYIPTNLNPADLATRDFSTFLENQPLWFQGPTFLEEPRTEWPIFTGTFTRTDDVIAEEKLLINSDAISSTNQDESPSLNNLFPSDETANLDIHCREAFVHILTRGETLTRTIHYKNRNEPSVTDIMETYSDVDKIINVIAWVQRASAIWRHKSEAARQTPLSAEERNQALQVAVRWEQRQQLANVARSIYTKNFQIREKQYRGLSLYLDKSNIIRLAGRIRNPELCNDFRNPMLLPYNGVLAKRIMEKAHRVTLHGGAQQMLQYIHQQFWIPKARQLAKEVIHACMVCKRYSFKNSEQQMAPLPLSRTTPGKAFLRTGVDYCGPVWLKAKNKYNHVLVKAYVCVFVCLVTRAVHLELVSDLTTDAFIATLRRFIARRGRVQEIISDHGTNFVGAVNEISRIRKHFEELGEASFVTEFGLSWNFTTERASHHGGIFEAAVKSAKKHLIRVIGDQKLTFEQYSTILAQVETCLNSRPLTKLSDDPMDFSALTPSHFLTGEQNSLFPSPDYTNLNQNRLGQWELLQQIVQNFWKRWYDEYLHSLLNRPKWNRIYENFRVGDLVLIKEDNMAPSRWKKGKIAEVYYGSDDLVRSALVRTATGTLKRPIVKLALLESCFDSKPSSIESIPEDDLPSVD